MKILLFSRNDLLEPIYNCSCEIFEIKTLQHYLSTFRFMPSTVRRKWRVWERPLRLQEWLEGTWVWCSRRTMHRPNVLWPRHLYHGSLHLCSWIQRRNMWGRSEPHFNILLQAFLSLACPKYHFVILLEIKAIFANSRCSTCFWYIQQRFKVGGLHVSSGSLTEYMRLFLWHL